MSVYRLLAVVNEWLCYCDLPKKIERAVQSTVCFKLSLWLLFTEWMKKADEFEQLTDNFGKKNSNALTT